ncbi:hypothetical protein LTR22_028456, partial [Elasticomyces elasticus]
MEGTGGRGSRIPILPRENHQAWFRQIRFKLLEKDVYWTLELVAGTPTLTPESSTTEPFLFQPYNSASFSTKANASAMSTIVGALSHEDQEYTEEFDRAKEVWEALQRKYQKRLQVTVR